MKLPASRRSFTLTPSDKFACQPHPKGGWCVTRVSPYDETEYHWALSNQDASEWRILLNGSTALRTTVSDPISVAILMIDLDRKAGLTPTPVR